MARTRSTPRQDPPAAGRADPWERRAGPLAALLLGLLLIQGLAFIGEASQTSDEAAHLAAGYAYLTTADFRLNPEHPPLIKEIAALPLLPLGLTFPSGSLWDMAEEWNIGRIFVHENRLPNDTILLLAGLMAGGAFASKFTAFWLLPILAALGVVLLATPVALPRRPWSARSAPAPETAPVPRRLLSLAYAIKTPIGTLLIVAAAVVCALRGRRRAFKDEAFLWLPVLITLAITCLWKVNIGLRHLLPIYPFLYLAAGRVAAPAAGPPGAAGAAGGSAGRLAHGALLACLGWNLLEAVWIAPYDLAYFNELVGGPRNGHRWLLDSSLDWGQSSKALRRFMTRENVNTLYCAFSGNSDPGYYGVRYQYVPGIGNLEKAGIRPDLVPEGSARDLLAVGAMVLHSVHFTDHSLYDWLKARPVVDMPGYSYLVYDITGDAGAHSYIAVLCLNFGLLDLAEFEARRALRLAPGNSLAQAVLDKIREYETTGGAPSPPGPE